MRRHIFLQARVSSGRLPGKMLLKIQRKTVFELIVERVRRVRGVDSVILVTGPAAKNKLLLEEAERLGIEYFCASEEHILDRFYQASKTYQPDIIIRINGDCPLIDPKLIELGLAEFTNCDILTIEGLPYGMGFEIFSAQALESSWQFNKNKGPQNPVAHIFSSQKFIHKKLPRESDLSHIRLSLDYEEDFTFITKVYEALYAEHPFFGIQEIVSLLQKHPELRAINNKYGTYLK